MTAVAPSAIRQALASTLDAVSDWRESRWPYEMLGYDPRRHLHRSYAVGILQTTTLRERQIAARGTPVTSRVGVRWLYQLRADNMRGDYDSALDAELTLVAAIMASWPTSSHIILRSASRTLTEDGAYVVGTITLDVPHVYALA